MGYPVSKGNSIQFTVGDEKLAYAVVFDDFVGAYYFGLFRWTGSDWQCPVFGDENGYIDENLTSDFIMRYGSVANFIITRLQPMQEKLKRYVNGSVPKPPIENKPECVGYDLSKDLNFDPVNLAFALNKEPPLSHAQ